MQYDQMKQIYRVSGWPDSFDATKFEYLRTEAEKADEIFQRQTAPLEHLEGLRVNQERLTEQRRQIAIFENEIDELKLKVEQLLSQSEVEKLEGTLDEKKRRLEELHRYVNPISPKQWEEMQHHSRKELEHAKSERQLMIDRQGRFSGGTDEEYRELIAEDHFGRQIRQLEAYLADPDAEARNNRMERKTRSEAEAVDEALRERWLTEQVKWWSKDDKWVVEWTRWFEAKRDLD